MLSFGFSTWEQLVVSSEIRKEKGESFDPILWILNRYELVYMIGSENDLIKLRANHRNNNVALYPIKTSPERLKKLFLSVLSRADQLSKEPEFYNTLTNTCATSILQHVNELRISYGESAIAWSKNILLPVDSDVIAYELWIIDTQLSLQQARAYYSINELSLQHADSPNYSKLIRKTKK